MPLLAIPNVSEGRDEQLLEHFRAAVERSGARVLDVHTDGIHNRSVFTTTGSGDELIEAMTSLACEAAEHIDLRVHTGVHPRVGALDVCPIVPHREPMTAAVATAVEVGESIAGRCDLPVYLYGGAAPDGKRELPELRRGGLEALIARSASEMPPDLGPHEIDPRKGIVCVGARGPLIAFNVWAKGDVAIARRVAASIRGKGGVRALGLALEDDLCQISMNLTDPATMGIEDVFAEIERMAAPELVIVATELVGLVPSEFMPPQDARAARMLKAPGRSLESVL